MRADGLHTVIITNGHADIQRIKLQACRAEDLFDGILVGGEEVIAGRHEKPHPSIFQAACKLAGCKAGEVITQTELGAFDGVMALSHLVQRSRPLEPHVMSKIDLLSSCRARRFQSVLVCDPKCVDNRLLQSQPRQCAQIVLQDP